MTFGFVALGCVVLCCLACKVVQVVPRLCWECGCVALCRVALCCVALCFVASIVLMCCVELLCCG